MTPGEFYNLYGPCRTQVYTVTAGVLRKIPANPDRYLLAFWRASADLTIMPDGGDLLLTYGTVWLAGSAPLIYTHHEHGALPSMGWQIGPSGWIGTNTVLTVQGIASGKPLRKANGGG